MIRRNAISLSASVFGCLLGLTGLEHGIGELLQSPGTPSAVVFASWPNNDFFRVVADEPAMSLIPSFLLSGLLTVALSCTVLVSAIGFSHRKGFGGVLILLSAALLVSGGGFGPPLIGFIVGAAALKNRSKLSWWRRHLPLGLRRGLGAAWPWLLGFGIAAWLALMPGLMLVDYFRILPSIDHAVPSVILAAFTSLLLILLSACARDSCRD